MEWGREEKEKVGSDLHVQSQNHTNVIQTEGSGNESMRITQPFIFVFQSKYHT